MGWTKFKDMNSESNDRSINFFCVGAQKAGTSWLYYRLRELPEFSIPPLKELHYFDRSPNYPSPSQLREARLMKRIVNPEWLFRAIAKTCQALINNGLSDARWLAKWYFSNYSDEWYLSLFQSLDKLRGEFTPAYSILDQKDIERMHQLAPEAKIIFILRNPIERAWSHYKFGMQLQHKTAEEILDKNNIMRFLNSDRQELRSDYLRTIDNYEKFYPKDQIYVCFYDSLKKQPLEFLQSIVQFLGGNVSNVSRHCQINAINNESITVDMPDFVREHLTTKYTPRIEVLADRYGDPCKQWLNGL